MLQYQVSSSSWGLGRAAVCDCGTPWTFLLPFFFSHVSTMFRAVVNFKVDQYYVSFQQFVNSILLGVLRTHLDTRDFNMPRELGFMR